MLLTPFGGNSTSTISPSDQLTAGSVTYDAKDPNQRLMRTKLYLLETLQYYDFLFHTSNGTTRWWWLVSDPGAQDDLPTKAYGPFSASADVPSQAFLAENGFSNPGTWNVAGRPLTSFSARKTGRAGTWYWFNASSDPTRIMNVNNNNDFKVAILGSYYFVDLPKVERLTSSNLEAVYKKCQNSSGGSGSAGPMLTLADILRSMATPPSGAQTSCTLDQIRSLIPGISLPEGPVNPPAWTNKVSSECFMIGQDLYPYYCQVWYDWDQGTQVTVFVQQDTNGSYSVRFDEMLPKGHVGPAIVYAWNGSQWTPSCCEANGGFVPMPVPNFVEAGGGVCRATIANNSYFGNLSIWSVALGDASGNWKSDFWYWFNNKDQGVLFSLAPAGSLTVIDYQTFVQNGTIEACVFDNPCGEISACSGNQAMALRRKPRFMSH